MVGDTYREIYKIVQSIPRGRVLTYGIISRMIGGRMSAQGVGWALKALGSGKQKDELADIPWHRVVNAQGGTSTQKLPDVPLGLQQALLESEGVVFNDEGRMNLADYLWSEAAGCHR